MLMDLFKNLEMNLDCRPKKGAKEKQKGFYPILYTRLHLNIGFLPYAVIGDILIVRQMMRKVNLNNIG
jgi:hypothetical protein